MTEQTSGNRPLLNGDTPAANKVLGRAYEQMKKSDWGELFEPTMTRQAVWADMYHELAGPVSYVTIEQVAKDTERSLNALGLRPSQHSSASTLACWVPAEAGAELWKWKKRAPHSLWRELVHAGRLTDVSTNLENPSQKPTGRVFSASEERSPYFQDPHMVTPLPTGNSDRARRTTDDSKPYRSTRSSSGRSKSRRYKSTDDSSDDEAVFTGDGRAQTNEYLRQIHEVTEFELLNATPRIEVATHRSLGQIKAFSGTRNKSDKSMQRLRDFVYEMKWTRASPNEWCMPFELSLRDGALHWYRQLPKKIKRTWSLLSEPWLPRREISPVHDVDTCGQEIPHARAPGAALLGSFKLGSPPTTTGLVPIGLPQLVEPAIEAECIYAFVGKSEWTKDQQGNDVITTVLKEERGRSLGEGVTMHGDMTRQLATAVRLLPGERMGWWSVQKSDKKARDETLLKWEAERYQQWLVKQQPIVDRPSYPTPRGILRRPEAAAKGHEGGNVDADDGSDNPDDSPVEDDSESVVQEHYQNLLATADDSAEVTNAEKDVAISSEALEEDSSPSESTAHGGEEVQQAAPGHASMTQRIPARAPDDSLAVPEQTFIATMCDKPNVPGSDFMYTEALDTMPTTHAKLRPPYLVVHGAGQITVPQETGASTQPYVPSRDQVQMRARVTRSRFQLERTCNYDIQLTSRAAPSVADDSRHGFDVGRDAIDDASSLSRPKPQTKMTTAVLHDYMETERGQFGWKSQNRWSITDYDSLKTTLMAAITFTSCPGSAQAAPDDSDSGTNTMFTGSTNSSA
ncbi:hypothetical protein ON010_g5108 [Phytophthora cinnamomi]|nr:hypothetical protein ON010_g5108 [Phytophthora cinnamomi]